ncbi:tyrosine-type recombinase/integrase [Pseudobutyrivibrio sp.]
MELFGNAVQKWMENFKKNSVKPSSYDRLETSFKLMSRYPLASVPLDQLDEVYMQDYINELVSDGYTLSTIKKQYHLITEYMDYANVKGVIDRPYHKAVRLPSRTVIKKEERSTVSYSTREQELLLAVLWTLARPAYAAAILMLETGMRIGEALALSWSDVDFRRRSVKVCKTFVRLGNASKSYIQQDAKTFTSNRVIPLSKKALELLNELKLKEGYSEDGYIIQNGSGKPLCYEAVRWQIHQACKKAGVPYYGQHVFRHTFATNCYYKGCDVKKLSKLLGHSDVTITYNIYIHLFGDDLEDVRLIVD